MGDGNLASFIEDVCGEGHLRVETDLGGGFVRLRSSEAERRQAAQDIRSSEDIIIEMLRNARDAHASNIFVACTREGSTRRIVMIDDGDGVPKHLQQTVFEPRVTSKLDSMHMDKWGVHGRGMALYSIAVNAESATISASDSGVGSAFVIQTDLTKLPEKTDQSSFPTFELNEAGTVAVRGPKNILRTTCEFAIESRAAVNVFIGSSTDIAATLYAFGLGKLSAEERLSGENDPRLPVCKRLSACSSLPAFHRTVIPIAGKNQNRRCTDNRYPRKRRSRHSKKSCYTPTRKRIEDCRRRCCPFRPPGIAGVRRVGRCILS